MEEKKKVKLSNNFDLDIADAEVLKPTIPDYRINISKNIEIYVKEFKSQNYLGFGRRDGIGGDPKYRFNMPLSLFPKVKQAIKAIDKHVTQNGK